MLDVKAMADAAAQAMKAHLAKALAPILQRLEAIEQQPAPKDGESVPVEQVERMVADAVAKAVAAIPRAVDGTPGRDAAHIEILPAIDETRAYPRGTFATHKGGLWRSFETTAGMKGWECIVDGLADVHVTQASERHAVITVTHSCGSAFAHSLEVPAMVYRGRWRAGSYDRGDTVTAKGGIWHCDTRTDSEPGADESAWTLAAKAGERGASTYTLALRNGFKGTEADFVASLKGEPGKPGPRGRDLTQLGFDGGKH